MAGSFWTVNKSKTDTPIKKRINLKKYNGTPFKAHYYTDEEGNEFKDPTYKIVKENDETYATKKVNVSVPLTYVEGSDNIEDTPAYYSYNDANGNECIYEGDKSLSYVEQYEVISTSTPIEVFEK